MPRLARIVIPGLPHHVTQRCNWRETVFFGDDDYHAYVSLNPVRARLVKRAEDWKWSSVHAHLTGVNDGLTTTRPLHARVDDFAAFLDQRREDEEFTALRKSEIIGRPIGDDPFIDGLEDRLGRTLRAGKRGPKGKGK